MQPHHPTPDSTQSHSRPSPQASEAGDPFAPWDQATGSPSPRSEPMTPPDGMMEPPPRPNIDRAPDPYAAYSQTPPPKTSSDAPPPPRRSSGKSVIVLSIFLILAGIGTAVFFFVIQPRSERLQLAKRSGEVRLLIEQGSLIEAHKIAADSLESGLGSEEDRAVFGDYLTIIKKHQESWRGFLSLALEPADAKVLIVNLNSYWQGIEKTPLPIGKHQLQISAPGYEPYLLKVEITNNEEVVDLTSTPIALRRHLGSASIYSEPAGIEFELVFKGSNTGDAQNAKPTRHRTPVLIESLPTGDYTIRWKRDDKNQDEDTSFKVSRNQTNSINRPFTTGFVKITSVPDGAKLFLDGEFLSPVPFEGALPIGEHTLVAKKDNWPDRKIKITPEVIGVKKHQFVWPHSSVSIQTDPDGANIFIDGRFLSNSAVNEKLSTGKHTLFAESKELGRSKPVEITIKDGKAHKPVTLTIPYGMLIANSKPSGATVYLLTKAGRINLGKTPLEKVLKPGEIKLSFEMDGRDPVSAKITMRGGYNQELTAKMEKR